MIQIIVQAQKASCRKSSGERITTGMVGKQVSFDFSAEWDGLVKTAVFEGSGVKKDVTLSGDTAVIPHECLTVPGGMLRVGVYGTDGTIQTPTIYTDIGQIEQGADPSGDESADPTLPIWAQLQAMMGSLDNLTTTARDNLVAAINEAAKSGGTAADVKMQVADGYIQYSSDGGANWNNLIAVAELIGEPGGDGKSAYQYAQDGGYTGTEAEFAAKLAQKIPAVDSTLTKSGQAADAAAVRKELDSLSEEIGNLSGSGGSGMSSTERSTLIAVVNAIGAFNVANGQELIDAFNDAWVQKIPATGITLSAASLSFTAGTSQSLTASVEPSDSTDTVAWSSSNPAVATVSNGVVTPVSNGDCIITATAGSVSASCAINVAFAEEVVYYTITNNLTNCTSDNAAASVVEGGSYTATLTADDGYTLDGASVSIVVNGVDVTDTAYSGGVVTIQSVTGDVVITAISVEVGATEEVTLLKSITGDGASYIDTEIAPESLFSTYGVDISVEMSAKIPNYTEEINFFGANQSKLYGSYGAFCATSGTMYCRGIDENNAITSQDSNGFWNSTGVPNLYTEQRWYKYATTPDGTLSTIYMDESMSTLPSSANANFTAFANYNETALRASVPIIPMYIFAVNVGDGANQVITDGTPTVYTLYYFRIKRYSTGELLHEYLPAKQGDKIGMYDTVTQTFHANQGTGTFSYEEVSA